MTSDFCRRSLLALTMLGVFSVGSISMIGCQSRSMNSSQTKEVATGTFAGSLRPWDLVTFYGRVPDARYSENNPLLCVYASYKERTRGEDQWVNSQTTLNGQQLVIAAMNYSRAVVLPQLQWFQDVPLHESFLAVLERLRRDPGATVPAVEAAKSLRGIKTPRIPSPEAQRIADKRKELADATEEFLGQVRWQHGTTQVTMWTADQKKTNAFLGRLSLDIDARERQLASNAQCSAEQINFQMQPGVIDAGNNFDLVNLLNSAVFYVAYLPDPADPLGRSGATSQMPQCPKTYPEFLVKYDPGRTSFFDNILLPCGAAPQTQTQTQAQPSFTINSAAAAPQYPAAVPSRLSDFGSPSPETANAVLDTAIARCTPNATALDCTGLAPGTDPEIVKARLEVIREFSHYEFAQIKLGRPDRTAASNVWRAVNKLLIPKESSNP
jgi:hypothetical protein